MPLVATTLANGLGSAFDGPSFPVTDCAASWADALQAYAGAIVPPSSQVATAAAAFETALSGMEEADQAQQVISAALAAFAVSVASGMQPAFTGVPPPSPWSHTFSNTPSAMDAGRSIADSIDTWMRLGTATNNASGITSVWS